MPLELSKQVTSRELSERLKKLGVPQESLFYYAHKEKLEYVETYRKNWKESEREGDIEPCDFPYYIREINGGNIFSAFTCSELGEMLPDSRMDFDLLMFKTKGKYQCQLMKWVGGSRELVFKTDEESESESEARGLMLEYLIKSGIIS